MNINNLNNLNFIKALVSAGHFNIGEMYTYQDLMNNIALYLNRTSYYGTYDPTTGETNILDSNKTSFTSTSAVNLLILGSVVLSSIPSVTGGGAIVYNGSGSLTVGSTVVYGGSGGGGTWGSITGTLSAQADLATRIDPVNSISDGVEKVETLLDQVKSWTDRVYPAGTSAGMKNKLQAGAGGDWVTGQYLGATSGVITGTKAGEFFYGADVINSNKYRYECYTANVWYRVQSV